MQNFSVIYADPAWSYNQWNGVATANSRSVKRGEKQVGDILYKASTGAVQAIYPIMKQKDLLELGKDIENLASKNSLLFLWYVRTHIPDAIELSRAWGFEPVAKCFTWVKTYKDKPNVPYMGLGHYSRSGSEDMLVCKRGKGLPIKSHSVREVRFAPIGKHSAKPLEFYGDIENLVGQQDNKLELFARKAYPNWLPIGNEIDYMDIKEALPLLFHAKHYQDYLDNLPELSERKFYEVGK